MTQSERGRRYGLVQSSVSTIFKKLTYIKEDYTKAIQVKLATRQCVKGMISGCSTTRHANQRPDTPGESIRLRERDERISF